MRFIRKNGLLAVQIDNPRKTTPVNCELSELGKIDSPFVEHLLGAFHRKYIGSPYYSQINYVRGLLRPFGKFLNSWIINRPEKAGPADLASWQGLVCDFALWWLARTDTKAALATRCSLWQKLVLPFFDYLQEEDLLPLGLVFPKLKLPRDQASASPKQPKLIGEPPAIVVPVGHALERAPIDRTLAGPVFWRGDAEYLDEIENLLRKRDALLASVLNDYWLKLVKDYRTGRRLKREVSEAEWQAQKAGGEWAYGYQGRTGKSFDGSLGGVRMPLCSAQNPRGHVWLLLVSQHLLLGLDNVRHFGIKAIQTHPAATVTCLKNKKGTPIEPLRRLTALSGEQYAQIPLPFFFWRFLGLLSIVDMAVAATILIREHPNFTPEAIGSAKLLSTHGKSYLLVTDSGSSERAAIFSVNKARAGTRKYSILSKQSARVVRHLLRATAHVRDLLRRSGHRHWRYLFLGYELQRGLGHPPEISPKNLNRVKSRASLVRLYPELIEAGLGVGTLDFSKVRATQGVLAWFDKGSVQAVHRRLGNSYRISIQHYIPEPLLAAWNERIIRRFQNTLLVLAAADEDYLLDVVDMPSIGELHRFLAQLVYELPPGRSPIADRIQATFGERYRAKGTKNKNPKYGGSAQKESFHIRLNPSCIALLLAYRQWANTELSQEMQQQADRQTGITPRHFIELAGMLQAAVSSDQIGKDISRVLNVKALKKQFEQAEPKVADLVKQLSKKTIHFL